MSKHRVMSLDASDLDELDEAILDYFQEGRDDGRPWGIATPTVVREALREREYGDVPTRQTINNRLKKFQHAGHLTNRYSTGEYEFCSDPREKD